VGTRLYRICNGKCFIANPAAALTDEPPIIDCRACRGDLFGGSGSTLIACEQTGRNAYLMELDPLYADVIVQRWEQYTGKTALRDRQPAQHTDGGAQRRPSRSRAG
jgi:hypothetical protein